MSLQGNLDMFPVDEVLRMLVRSTRAASLTIESEAADGVIHVSGGAVLSAEFDPVIGLTEALLARGLVSPESIAALEGGRRTVLEVVDEDREAEASHLIAERSVEALHRIREADGGTFWVEVDRFPRVVPGFTFDLDELTDLASLRSQEWSNALAVLGDRAGTFGLCGQAPGDDDIVLSANAWRVVCAAAQPATIRSIAAVLGVSEFEVARELARLVQVGLAERVSAESGTGSPEALDAEASLPEAPTSREVDAPSQGGWWQEPERPAPADHDEKADEESGEPEKENTGEGLGRRSMGAFARRVLDA